MTRSSAVGICVALALAATQLSDSVYAQSQGNSQGKENDHGDHDNGRGNNPLSVTVSFGVGLNTAQPGNAVNHHVLPRVIDIKAGGVVNFAVAGFHQIIVYKPGKGVDDVVLPADPAALFINDAANRFYLGIAPAGGPLATPATANPSNAVNRIESVGFLEPGVYLVICNVQPHFLDGMFAFVRVSR